eukprot:scpid53318/ scgid20122/ 
MLTAKGRLSQHMYIIYTQHSNIAIRRTTTIRRYQLRQMLPAENTSKNRHVLRKTVQCGEYPHQRAMPGGYGQPTVLDVLTTRHHTEQPSTDLYAYTFHRRLYRSLVHDKLIQQTRPRVLGAVVREVFLHGQRELQEHHPAIFADPLDTLTGQVL